mgnify:CR=1 FL=1
MILHEGDKAPDFNLQDTAGNIVTLNELLGKKIVIYFYPKDDTPGCTIEACDIRDNYSIFKEKNIVVLGVSADNIESHKSFTDKFNLPFILLLVLNIFFSSTSFSVNGLLEFLYITVQLVKIKCFTLFI